ncbi:coagulation factor 5/8 type domain-containing protein [Streptomyces sp. NPDC046939]|uniref:coagulation factor 5/8 type domain-containing protein n=1 Tax=Streptomyces sp. NPDC046939 TaxID=3155376 RepID=UPI0033E04EAB
MNDFERTGPLPRTAKGSVQRRTVLTAMLGASAALAGGGVAVGSVAAASEEKAAAAPDFGPNVSVFDPSMSTATIQSRLNAVFSQQQTNQFGSSRFALLFKPGTYAVDANIGFYTQIAGLGLSPDDVTIRGAVHAEADWFNGNATHNFWRSAENLSVTPTGGVDRWAVSQAAPYRRIHLRGRLLLDDGGWSSGGYLADCKFDGAVDPGGQQQWFTRNSSLNGWSGNGNWNMMFLGSDNPPTGNWPSSAYTRVTRTPVIREKPFMYVDTAGNYAVFVPALRTNTQGTSWSAGNPAGTSIPIGDFLIAKPGVTAKELNTALAAGRHLLFTPGVYHLSETLKVTKANTVILGLGLATLIPDNGIIALDTDDVDGIKIAGIIISAGTTASYALARIGTAGATADHSANPTSLHDVFLRVGGANAGKAQRSLIINSNHVIGDHLWIWRADHDMNGGSLTGWTTNPAAKGLIVNGDDVTMYGLFVEHYQEYEVLWNGERGRTYFFQNEMPYDPPNQAAWMNGSTKGYAAYKVSDAVTTHEAWGLGSYCFFNANPTVVAERAFEVPNTPQVKLHHMVILTLGGKGTINHVVNNTGGPVTPSSMSARVTDYPG